MIESFKIKSEEFDNDGSLDIRFTQEGDNQIPDLYWENVPDGIRSLILVCFDSTTPNGIPWIHYIAYDINPKSHALIPGRFKVGYNSYGRQRYDGPRPPAGTGTHEYHFRLYALTEKRSDLDLHLGHYQYTFEQLSDILDQFQSTEVIGLYPVYSYGMEM